MLFKLFYRFFWGTEETFLMDSPRSIGRSIELCPHWRRTVCSQSNLHKLLRGVRVPRFGICGSEVSEGGELFHPE